MLYLRRKMILDFQKNQRGRQWRLCGKYCERAKRMKRFITACLAMCVVALVFQQSIKAESRIPIHPLENSAKVNGTNEVSSIHGIVQEGYLNGEGIETKQAATTAGECIAKAAVEMSRDFGGWSEMVASDLRGVPNGAYRKALDAVGFGDHDGRNCSVFVATVLRITGIDAGFPKHTANQYRSLTSSGLFENVTNCVAGLMKNLRPGDILIRPYHHVAIYVGNGRVAQAFLNTRQAGPIAAFVLPITSTFTTTGERIADRSNIGMTYEIFRMPAP